MTDSVLWSLDWRTPEEAALFFKNYTEHKFDKAVLMSLQCDKNTNPIFFSNVNIENMMWEKQEHGWLFCEEGELRWRRLNHGCIRFVYLGTGGYDSRKGRKRK